MKTLKIRKTAGIAALALAMSTGLAACSDDADDTAADETPSATDDGGDMDSDDGMDEGMDGAASQVFGEGCAAVPTDGAGSFDGMVQDPVATAASNNPLLTTLVTAVGEAGLVDTLNTADALTVFAPIDDAFAAVPEDALNDLLADQEALTGVLTYHVVGGQLGPDEVAGTHETLNGAEITVEGSGENFTVEGANVICGNVPTANATVYIIDQVLMP